jgi:carbonic anhydrase/acetyltransferase-like protein (isoleucine patch superfamily)
MPVYAIGDRIPTIDPSAFIHPDAVLIGNVTVGAEASVWPAAVLRGDHGRIIVGAGTSVQDGTIVHCTAKDDTVIGSRCVIGHRVHLEGCTIGDGALVGSGAVVLNGAAVGRGSLVAAQALVAPRMVIPDRQQARGVPAKIIPEPPDESMISSAAQIYIRNSHWYRAELRRID